MEIFLKRINWLTNKIIIQKSLCVEIKSNIQKSSYSPWNHGLLKHKKEVG